MACDRIRMGGTISGSTLSGGTLIESRALGLTSWNGVYGHPGFKGSDWSQFGQDGNAYRANKRYSPRFLTLTIAAWDRDSAGTVTAPGGRCEELDDNIDTLMGLIDGEGGQFILERDMTDGTTRWIRAQVFGQVTSVQGPVFGNTTAAFSFVVPLIAAYPMWQSETESTTTLSGADSLVQLGNGRISNPVLVFAGDGTLTIDGYTLEVSGSAAAVTVDVSDFSVTQSGSAADDLLIPSRPWWVTFGAGTTTTSSDVSIDVTYRDHWLT